MMLFYFLGVYLWILLLPLKITNGSMIVSASDLAADYPDFQAGIRYDEYPVVVPKRAAQLLDKILVALSNVEPEGGSEGGGARRRSVDSRMERRGTHKGRTYWRCYFNAVSCFK